MRLTFEKYLLKTLPLLILLLIFAACNRDELNSEAKPFVKTTSVSLNITADVGLITLSGEFVLPITYNSINYGFGLSTDEHFTNNIEIIAGSNNSPGKFEVAKQLALISKVKYYVRA